MRKSRQRGLTLIEVMVVVVIIGILGTLAVSTLSKSRPRFIADVAARDFSALLGEAQARAASTQGNVWLMVYVNGANAPATGGGYLLFEDQNGNLDFSTYLPTDDPTVPEASDRVAETVWFDLNPSNRVAFEVPTSFSLDAPFTGNTASSCSFCTASPDGLRGAIVFSPDGQARLVNGTGATDSGALGVVTFSSSSTEAEGFTRSTAVAVSAATGFSRITRH